MRKAGVFEQDFVRKFRCWLSIMIRRRNRCALCGQSHVVGVACACPRCHQFHPGGDGNCLACAICGRWHSGDECVDVYYKKCCKSCGVVHDNFRLCPCPHCHNWHAGGFNCLFSFNVSLFGSLLFAGQDCREYADVSCGWASSALDDAIRSCCSLCGQLHDQLRRCPCPRCLEWHPDADCRDVVVAIAQFHPCRQYVSLCAFPV